MIGRHRTLAASLIVGTLLLSPIAITQSALAQVTSAGTYSASFLSVPIGARLMSTPDVVSGLRPDASMMFSNPAVMADISNKQVFFSTATWLEDLSLSAGSAVIPLEQYDLTWSLGTRLLYSGGLQGLDTGGNVVEEQSFYDLALSTGVSKRLEGTGLALGGSATYVRENQPQQTGTAVVFSVGASYEFDDHRVDFFASDFGADMSFAGQSYPIDSRVVLGYGRTLRRAWGVVDLGAQMAFSRSDQKRLEFGGAYHVNQFFTVRSALHHDIDAPATSQTPITAGFGFNYNAFAIDYAYTSQEFFPSTHTFSFNYSFGHGAVQSSQSPKSAASSTKAPRTSTPAPVKTVPTPAASAGKANEKTTVSYLVVAGTHNRLESARAEVRALRLLNVPAVAEQIGGQYRVLIGRYDSLEAANKAANNFMKKGHRFEVVHEQS